LLGKGPSAPILFEGIGHAAAENSRLLYRVLVGNPTSYSWSATERVTEYPQSTGRDALLVTAIQTRNNARIVFSGSLSLFSNKFFTAPVKSALKNADKSGNEDFCSELSLWLFQGRGMLRAGAISHRLAEGGPLNPLAYRVKDNIEFWVTIEEQDVHGNWKPFLANDVQLELVMIDPYIRTALSHDAKGKFHASLQLPDVYGVFKFVLSYHKLGYSNLDLSQQVSVHPFRHDQFERFIDVAYPYYASAFSMMAAFFVFGIVFLYAKPDQAKRS